MLSLFVKVKGITNCQVQLISTGVFLFGLGEWKNHKARFDLQPPHISTGGAAVKWSWTERSPDLFGLFLDLAGLVLIVLGIWDLLN
jgi:hypothetical protein